MVYITGDNGITKKFACRSCIKGHRSSKCVHSDRKLFEIKRKGRPITQCAECRELRKTRQIHIKCLCQEKQAKDQLEVLQDPVLCSQLRLEPYRLASSAETNRSNFSGHVLQVDTQSKTCTQCARPQSSCVCSLEGNGNVVHDQGFSSDSSESSMTPPSSHSAISPKGTLLHTLGLPSVLVSPTAPSTPSPRPHLPIPIYDPTDDIDSDTPQYKPQQDLDTDEADVLRPLSHTSSEDLIQQIYSDFNQARSPPQDHESQSISSDCHCDTDTLCMVHVSKVDSASQNQVDSHMVADQDGDMTYCGCGSGHTLASCPDCVGQLSSDCTLSSSHT